MNPFDELNARFDQNRLQQFIAAGQPPVKKTVTPQKQGFQWSSLISEGAGTGGALGGAAAGAAIGSVVPVLGTAVGGLIGAGVGGFLGGTGGKLVEDKVQGKAVNVQDALTEGAVSGVFGAGPLRLAKFAAGGASALRGAGGAASAVAPTLESALANNAVQAGSQPLKTSLSGRLTDAGNKALASQYGTIGKNVARETDPINTIGNLAKIGVTKPQDAERLAQAVTGSDGILTQQVAKAVGGAGKVSIDNVPSILDNAIVTNSLSGLPRGQAATNMVQAHLASIQAAKGSPESVINAIRSLESQTAQLLGRGGTYHLPTSTDKSVARALGDVTEALKDQLYNAAGGNKNVSGLLTPQLRQQLIDLQPKSKEWASFVDNDIMKAKDIGTLRRAQAPFVNISKIIDEGDLNSMTFGGRVGNFFNGQGNIRDLAAGVAIGGIKNPVSRATGTALRGTANALDAPLTSPGAKGIVGNMAFAEGGQAAMGVARGTAPTAMMNGMEEQPATLEDAVLGATSADPLSTGQFADPMAMQQQAPAPQSPYPRENLLADIQRDPANADKYIAYFQQMDEIFNPAVGADYNANTATQLAMSDNGLSTLNQLEGLYEQAGGGGGKVEGGIRNLFAGAGLNSEVSAYNDLSASAQSQLAKAINGGGQVSDTDALLIANALPKITDSPEAAQAKLNALKQRLITARHNMMMYNGGAQPQSTTLEDTLMQQGAY